MALYSYNKDDVVKDGVVRVKRTLGGILTTLWMTSQFRLSAVADEIRRKQWNRRRLVLLKRSSRGPLRLVVILDSGDTEQVVDLRDYMYISRGDPNIRPHSLAITFLTQSKSTFRFCTDSDLFNVYLLPNSLLEFHGECLLQVTRHRLCLLDVRLPHKVVVAWPLGTIRQYGHPRDENFTFIAGRSSPTGEGLFLFNTTEAHEIYNKIRVVTQRVADARRIASRSMERLNERSAESPCSSTSQSPLLAVKVQSFGSQSDVAASPSPSPPIVQQTQRRTRTTSSSSPFSQLDKVQISGHESPARTADRRPAVPTSPPPYSGSIASAEGSPTRPVFTTGADHTSTSPPTHCPPPPPTASGFPAEPCLSHSTSSPRHCPVLRHAVSDVALSRLPEYANSPSSDYAQRSQVTPTYARRNVSEAHMQDTEAPRDHISRSVAPPVPPKSNPLPKTYRRHQ